MNVCNTFTPYQINASPQFSRVKIQYNYRSMIRFCWKIDRIGPRWYYCLPLWVIDTKGIQFKKQYSLYCESCTRVLCLDIFGSFLSEASYFRVRKWMRHMVHHFKNNGHTLYCVCVSPLHCISDLLFIINKGTRQCDSDYYHFYTYMHFDELMYVRLGPKLAYRSEDPFIIDLFHLTFR